MKNSGRAVTLPSGGQMKISEIHKGKKYLFSAEVFPPKKTGNMEVVIRALKDIKGLKPDFVSVTYGAGGDGAETTADVASVAIDAFDLNAVAHLTAVNMTVEKLENQIEILKKKNVENILVLRGDIGEDSKFYDFRYANELALYIKKHYPEFELIGACYPEGHTEAESLDKDLDNVKRKVDSGIDFLITQLFFSNRTFYDFMEKARKKGITVPVLAGIMPIVSDNQINRIVKMCGVEIPTDFSKLVANNSGEELFEAGTDYAIGQIKDLIQNSVSGIHLYTMNKGNVAKKIFGAFEKERAL